MHNWRYLLLYVHMQVQRCDICQHVNKKVEIIAPELHPVLVKSPWYHLGVDFIGPIAYKSPTGEHHST